MAQYVHFRTKKMKEGEYRRLELDVTDMRVAMVPVDGDGTFLLEVSDKSTYSMVAGISGVVEVHTVDDAEELQVLPD
jgi:hypothetical protein